MDVNQNLPESEPRFPLHLSVRQLNDLKGILDVAAQSEANPDAEIFKLIDQVRVSRREVEKPVSKMNYSLVENADCVVLANDAAVAAIQFALDDDDGMQFLRLWNEGEFDVIRDEWPDAPEEIFIGADPLHKSSK